MIYQVIGTMSGSSMDGLDLVFVALEENAGQWKYTILHADCMAFDDEWKQLLPQLTHLSGRDLLRTHTRFGHWMGEQINQFITRHQLEHKVHFIASHGHTVFHEPNHQLSFQLGDGASIAAITQLPVISDLRNMDIALGGQGAPIVPIGEKLLWPQYAYFLNLGGIANISIHQAHEMIAFDVCAANRVLNVLANEAGLDCDTDGNLAAAGSLNQELLNTLNDLPYYQKPAPKSLANEWGTEVVYPLIQSAKLSSADASYTYCKHIAHTLAAALNTAAPGTLLVSGGGAHHLFLMQCIREALQPKQIEVVAAEKELIDSKEALVMALMGALRWREEVNVLAQTSGASRNSVGGALWMGQD